MNNNINGTTFFPKTKEEKEQVFSYVEQEMFNMAQTKLFGEVVINTSSEFGKKLLCNTIKNNIELHKSENFDDLGYYSKFKIVYRKKTYNYFVNLVSGSSDLWFEILRTYEWN